MAKAQQNFVIQARLTNGSYAYLWTGDRWEQSPDGLKVRAAAFPKYCTVDFASLTLLTCNSSQCPEPRPPDSAAALLQRRWHYPRHVLAGQLHIGSGCLVEAGAQRPEAAFYTKANTMEAKKGALDLCVGRHAAPGGCFYTKANIMEAK